MVFRQFGRHDSRGVLDAVDSVRCFAGIAIDDDLIGNVGAPYPTPGCGMVYTALLTLPTLYPFSHSSTFRSSSVLYCVTTTRNAYEHKCFRLFDA